MLDLIKFLNNDNVKKVGGILGIIAAAVTQMAAPHTIAFKIATALTGVLAGMGVVSGGTKGAQPAHLDPEINRNLEAGG